MAFCVIRGPAIPSALTNSFVFGDGTREGLLSVVKHLVP